MNKIMGGICILVGIGLLAALMPVYDNLWREAVWEGGTLAIITFMALLVLGAAGFIVLGGLLLNRKKPEEPPVEADTSQS